MCYKSTRADIICIVFSPINVFKHSFRVKEPRSIQGKLSENCFNIFYCRTSCKGVYVCVKAHILEEDWIGMCLVNMEQVGKRQLWFFISSQEPGRIVGGLGSTFICVNLSNGKQWRMKKVDFFNELT